MIPLPWAKTDTSGDSHALLAHSLDVAAVLVALCGQRRFRGPLERSAGAALTPQTIARLAVLAALHDIGKLHPDFQAKAPGWGGPPPQRPLAHSGAGFGLLKASFADGPLQPLVRDLMGWGPAIAPLLQAVFAHHGRPVAVTPATTAHWPAPWARYDWRTGATAMAQVFRNSYPLAFTPGPSLPGASPFFHQFAGLVALADWIGSSRDFFPFVPVAGPDYAVSAHDRAERAVAAIALDIGPAPSGAGFDAISPHPPRNAQTAIGQMDPTAPLLVIEAETGAGKTEAALWHFARAFAAGQVDALYFALPTRAAATQIHARIDAALRRMFGTGAPEATLAIPGQRLSGQTRGHALPGFETRWDDATGPVPARWPAEQATRFLAAPVAIGTVDQALLAGLQVTHAPMRGACLARSLLVVDEVHASDAYMTEVLKHLLDGHLAIGGRALLMSATLGSVARARLTGADLPSLEQARALPYPTLWSGATQHPVVADARGKAVQMATRPGMDAGPLADKAIRAADRGARVLVVRNTVTAALAAYQAVLAAGRGDLLLQVNGGPALHHARFAPEDRALLNSAVETALAPDPARPPRGVIVIGSQTLEQSLDIDADLLLTDLCPIDVLLQRLGRLHRHALPRPAGFDLPQAFIMLPGGGLDRLTAPAFDNGLGAFRQDGGWTGIYLDLPCLSLTAQAIVADPVWQIPAMNRDLVERCTHPQARAAEVAARGWEGYETTHAGREAAQKMLGRNVVLDRRQPLPHSFDADSSIMTRLGEMGPDAALTPGTIGPFGQPITRLPLPARWTGGLTVPDVVAPTFIDGGLAFVMGDQRFTYTRLGVERHKSG